MHRSSTWVGGVGCGNRKHQESRHVHTFVHHKIQK